MIKKLRYYARFIVVCLLLNNRDIVQKLMEELSGLVDDYIKIFKPADSNEWQSVLQEISTFLEVSRSSLFRFVVLKKNIIVTLPVLIKKISLLVP